MREWGRPEFSKASKREGEQQPSSAPTEPSRSPSQICLSPNSYLLSPISYLLSPGKPSTPRSHLHARVLRRLLIRMIRTPHHLTTIPKPRPHRENDDSCSYHELTNPSHIPLDCPDSPVVQPVGASSSAARPIETSLPVGPDVPAGRCDSEAQSFPPSLKPKRLNPYGFRKRKPKRKRTALSFRFHLPRPNFLNLNLNLNPNRTRQFAAAAPSPVYFADCSSA